MSSNLKKFLKNQPVSLSEELEAYHLLSEEAKKKGNDKLAARWELVVQLIRAFVHYLHSSRETSFLTEFLNQVSINDRAIETQEIALYTASSLNALRNNNAVLAKELMGYAEETKEAGIRSRHWLSWMKHELSTHHSSSESSLEEAAIQYRAHALNATNSGKEAIAHHWLEAACLSQEASRKQGLGLSTYITSGNEMLAAYWELSKAASHDAAKLKVQVALALEQDNPALAQEYDHLALLTEQLSSDREKLVRAIINGEIEIIPHWKKVSDFLNKSLDFRHSLKNFSENDPLLIYQKVIITSSEQAAEAHRGAISELQKKKKPLLRSILFAEQGYEKALQALKFYKEENFLAAEILKKQISLYHDGYQFSKKAAQAKQKWYTLRIPFLYWKYRTQKIENALRKSL